MKREPLFMSEFDRWIIGALLFALAAVLWWIMLDIRTQSTALAVTVGIDSNRLTDLERRATMLEESHLDLKNEIKGHRQITEGLHLLTQKPVPLVPYHQSDHAK